MFVSIIGRPSVGKSTLINTIIGEKVSIVSETHQTTRNLIRGIYTDQDSQIVFIDTPGVNLINKTYNNQLTTLALNLKGIDAVIYLVDVTRTIGEEEDFLKETFEALTVPKIVVFNKIDQVDAQRGKYLKNYEKWIDYFQKYVKEGKFLEISALEQIGITELITLLKGFSNKEENIHYYPEEYYTIQSLDFRIGEIIREKLFEFVREEVPHSCYVDILEVKDQERKIEIEANIYVSKDSQKGIIIGKD